MAAKMLSSGTKSVSASRFAAPARIRQRPRQASQVTGFFTFNRSAVKDTPATATPSAAVTKTESNGAAVQRPYADLGDRLKTVQSFFPTALGVDDFVARVEVALSGYAFTGDNSIACTNLCRDEITVVLKDKIEGAFGSSFNTNGLGGVLTCGVTGIGAGLSHSPQDVVDGRERYIFFSFPHVAVDPSGTLSVVNRPGRSGASCACGALAKCLGELKVEGLTGNLKNPGVHDAIDPEYSILKQRLARRIQYEEKDIKSMDLAEITKVAERTITDDLEVLIEKAVNTEKADYAVITGIQIHNWQGFNNDQVNLEFVAPVQAYVVMKGQKTVLDLAAIPSLSPRMISLLAQSSSGASGSSGYEGSAIQHPNSTLQEIPAAYLSKRLGWFPGVDATTPVTGTSKVSFGTPAGKEGQAVRTSFIPPVKK